MYITLAEQVPDQYHDKFKFYAHGCYDVVYWFETDEEVVAAKLAGRLPEDAVEIDIARLKRCVEIYKESYVFEEKLVKDGSNLPWLVSRIRLPDDSVYEMVKDYNSFLKCAYNDRIDERLSTTRLGKIWNRITNKTL